MIVYIETLILDNFSLTYFICDLTYALSGYKRDRKRMFFVALVSTILSFVYLATFQILWLNYLIKFLSLIICSVILFLKKQRYFSSTLIFIFSTMVVGGVMTFICTLITPASITGRIDFSFSYGLIVVLGYIITLIIKKLYLSLNKGKVSNSLIFKVKTSINGVPFTLKGFLDTGNRLIDNKTALPVVIVKVSSIIKGFSPATFADLIEKGRANYISYTTVTGGVSKIMLIYPEYFDIEGQKNNKDVVLGISFSGFYGDYDMILHPSLINK